MTARTMLLAAACAATLLVCGCKPETQAPDPVRPVLSMIVEPSYARGAAVVGTVEPRFTTGLGFRVLGRVIARPVNVGDLVEAGQVVAAVDATELDLAVQSARAELSRSEAQLANASAAEGRKRVLIASEAITKASLDSAEQSRSAAEATVAHAQANLTKAIEQRSYAQLKAEFAGVVTAVGADVGQVVSPGQTVVTVARPDVREAVVDIGPDFPVALRIGLPFNVSLQLAPAIEVHGEIREIAPQADPVTRMRRVRISLFYAPSIFRLGSTVSARLDAEQDADLRVPASAVLGKDGEKSVWIVDTDGTVSLRKIDVVAEEGGLRVTGGLAAGSRIVTAGIHSLKPGQRVRIEEEPRP
jgi:RND family efflux transporter MFP subunit